MGLLDDAIRQHLDLKRRRGADPAEVERAERDALGPVRRGPEGSDEVDLDHAGLPDDDLVYEEDAAYNHEEPHDFAGPVAGEHSPAPPPEFEPSLGQETEVWHPDEAMEPEDSPPAQDPVHAPLEEEPIAQAPPEPYVAPAPPPPAPPPSPAESHVAEPPPAGPSPAGPPPADLHPADPHSDLLDGDTAEYDMEREHVEGEDVLEETPEFLQDTPDHDRLWFEQRPPKDFDFEE
jgi:hypothetical protein